MECKESYGALRTNPIGPAGGFDNVCQGFYFFIWIGTLHIDGQVYNEILL